MNCSQCGVSIPSGQSVCSMCYGDIDFGRDGYYRQQMEEEERWNIEQQEKEYNEKQNEEEDIGRLNRYLDEEKFNKENPIIDDLPF